MIVQKKLKNGFYHTYSDENYYIRGGHPEGIYSDAIDAEPMEYVETDEKIEDE